MGAIYFFQKLIAPFWDVFFEGVTLLGEQGIAVAVLALTYWCIDKKAGALGGLSLTCGASLGLMLKNIFQIPRPFDRDPSLRVLRKHTATGYSFPSNHSLTASQLFIWLSSYTKRLGWKLLLWLPVVLVPMSRIYLAVHTLEDVLAGVALAIAVFFLFRWFFAQVEKRPALLWFSLLPPFMSLATALLTGATGDALSDPIKAGALSIGVTVGLWIERKYICFEAKAPLPVQIGKAVIGFAGLGLIMVGIKAVLPYNDLSHVIRYGVLGIWFAAGAPAVMKLCFKKKGESK